MLGAGDEILPPRAVSRLPVAAGTAILLAFSGALWLWAQYGTTVFFETIRTGFVACFG